METFIQRALLISFETVVHRIGGIKVASKWTDYLLKKHNQVHIKVSVEMDSVASYLCTSENFLVTETRVLKPGKLSNFLCYVYSVTDSNSSRWE